MGPYERRASEEKMSGVSSFVFARRWFRSLPPIESLEQATVITMTVANVSLIFSASFSFTCKPFVIITGFPSVEFVLFLRFEIKCTYLLHTISLVSCLIYSYCH